MNYISGRQENCDILSAVIQVMTVMHRKNINEIDSIIEKNFLCK